VALATLADIHAHLNIPVGDTSHDVELQGFLDAATATITYATGPQAATTFTETRDGGGSVIMLDNPPILSITSVTEYWTPAGQVLTAQQLGSGNYSTFGYSLDDPVSGKLTRRTAGGFASTFLGGRGSVVIVYIAGTATTAPDVRLAALEDIRGLYQQTQQGRSVGGGAIGSNSEDQWSAGPMHLFPRLANLLEAPQRTQSVG